MVLKKALKSFVFLFLLSSCNNMTNGQGTKTVSVDEFEKKLSSGGVQLLDVRTPEEYAERHLKDAVNINFNADDFINKIEHLDKSKPVMVYCLSGGRSAKASALLSKKGFKEVYNMDGGILAWAEAKKPLDSPGKEQSGKDGMSMDDYLAKVKSDKLVLVDFNAVWCGPCKVLKPTLDKLADKYKDKLILTPIDVDQNPALADEMHIKGIPLMIMYKDGKEVWRQVGVVDKSEIESVIKSNIK